MEFLSNIPLLRWFLPNIGIKRWVVMSILGIILISAGLALALIQLFGIGDGTLPGIAQNSLFIAGIAGLGIIGIAYGVNRIINNLLAPYRRQQEGNVIDLMMDFNRRKKGFKFVAIGGGTGLPASLRGMKQ